MVPPPPINKAAEAKPTNARSRVYSTVSCPVLAKARASRNSEWSRRLRRLPARAVVSPSHAPAAASPSSRIIYRRSVQLLLAIPANRWVCRRGAVKIALLTYTGMENGKIRTVFSAILHFKKPAHRSVAPEYALAIATSSTHARDFSQAAALPTQLCLTDQRFIRPPTPLFGKRSRSLGSVAERSASHFPMSVKLHEH